MRRREAALHEGLPGAGAGDGLRPAAPKNPYHPHRTTQPQLRIADCGLRIVQEGVMRIGPTLQIRNPQSEIRN